MQKDVDACVVSPPERIDISISNCTWEFFDTLNQKGKAPQIKNSKYKEKRIMI